MHIVYWVMFLALLLLFFVFVALNTIDNPHERFNFFNWCRIMTGFAIVPGVIGFYMFYTLLFNRFLRHKKFALFFIAGSATALLSALAGAGVASIPVVFGPRFLFGDGYRSATTILLLMSAGAFINGIIGTLVKGFITWFEEIKTKEELNKKNYELELSLVKSQINPHFLFNTINNIDILITKDAELASAYLNKLSDIMRFMLYETKTESIPLEKELQYIEKYIELQKIRTSNANYVKYNIQGNANALAIAPMLFIPFIENAFKHTEHTKAQSHITIDIAVCENNVTFLCENTFANKPLTTAQTGGMGNSLIHKRIALLYPGKHNLTVSHVNNIYSVKLALKL